MNLNRWNDPFSGLSNMHSQLDDMFSSFFDSAPMPKNLPTMDIYSEDNKKLIVEASIPGFDKEDVEVNVHNGLLEIKGEKNQESQEKSKKRSYVMRESHSSFYRSVVLPKNADADNIAASFDKGLLKVTIPFAELPAPKKVTIAGPAKENKK